MNAVSLTDSEPGKITNAVLRRDPQSVSQALDVAGELTDLKPFVGQGNTRDVWEALATLAAADVALARTVEPHVDAITILEQAGHTYDSDDRYGVFAAEGPDVRLTAESTVSGRRLNGVKPWCSLAGTLSHALVTAWIDDDHRQLFRVSLQQPGVAVDTAIWSARGLQEIPSGPVTFADAAAEPVGEPGWYLRRPGFAWGGISVAACWYGGAVGVARCLLQTVRRRRTDDQLLLMHLGVVDARLAECRHALAQAAARLDTHPDESADLLAQRVRATAARTCEEVLQHVGHALGPGPLATDPAHGKRVADLELYIRQHHAERDEASLGRMIRDVETTW